tara:strand:- start:1954 stop:2781 length:828 start_codon:yes stop_codon:yes gene_type:complete
MTKNEERNLPGCIASVKWSDDIVIYDSYSEDNTAQIANDFGVRIIRRPNYDTSLRYGGDESFHRNWALKNIRFKNKWIFFLDADERLGESFLEEIKNIKDETLLKFNAFSLRRKDYFMKKHLKYSQQTHRYIRLFRPEFCHFERIINPGIVVKGKVGSLYSYIDHFPFSKGIKGWVDKHNEYSTFEAKQILNERESINKCIKLIINTDNKKEKTKYLKKIFYYLKGRPLLRFFQLYLFKKGFLDGFAGLRFCLLMAVYEYLISLKIIEIRQNNKT